MGRSCWDKVSLLKEICCPGGQQHLHIMIVPQSLHSSEIAMFYHEVTGLQMWRSCEGHPNSSVTYPGDAQYTVLAV